RSGRSTTHGSRSTGNNLETGRTAREAVLRFSAQQGGRDARPGEIVERAPQPRGRIERVRIDRLGDCPDRGERSGRRRATIKREQYGFRLLPGDRGGAAGGGHATGKVAGDAVYGRSK